MPYPGDNASLQGIWLVVQSIPVVFWETIQNACMMPRRVSYNPHILKEVSGHHQLSTSDRYIHARGAVAEVVDVGQFLIPNIEMTEGMGVRTGGNEVKLLELAVGGGGKAWG